MAGRKVAIAALAASAALAAQMAPNMMMPLSHCVVLQCESRAQLSWQIDPSSGNVTFEMQGISQGWLGVGLSPSKQMPNADLAIAWLPDLNSPSLGSVRDYWVGSSNARPSLDSQQDNTFLYSSFNTSSGIMTVRWSRPLRTSDATDIAISPGRQQNVIWAISSARSAAPSADGSTMRAHDASTHASVLIDFGMHSDCVGVCPGDAPRRYDVMRKQCLGNGWTPAEAAGDRDGGASRPRLTRTVTRTVTYSTQVPVPSASPSAAPPAAATPTVPLLDARTAPSFTSPTGTFNASWAVSNATGAWLAYFQVSMRVVGGWAAIGWNPSAAAMTGSEMVVTRATPTTQGATWCAGVGTCPTCCTASAANYYATGKSMPSAGRQGGAAGDAQLLNASVAADGSTVVTFTRPLSSLGTVSASSVSTYAIWAYGDGALGYHTARGAMSTARITFAPGTAAPSASPAAQPSPAPSTNTGGANASTNGTATQPVPAAIVAALDAIASPMLADSRGIHSATWRVDSGVGASGSGAAPGPAVAYFQMATKQLGGWAALGFNPQAGTMTGSDIIVGTATPATQGATWCAGIGTCPTCCTASLQHLHARARSFPAAGPASGGASDAVLVNASVATTGHTVITFSRPVARIPGTVNANGRRMTATDASVSTYVVWAYGSSPTVGMHAAAGASASMVTIAANATAPVATVSSFAGEGSPLYALHGACMVLAYWACMFLGAWAAKFKSVSPWMQAPLIAPAKAAAGATALPPSFHSKARWFVAHVYLQSAAIAFIAVGCAAIAAVKVSRPAGRILMLDSQHSRVAVAAIVLACLQYVLGLVRPHIGDTPVRRAWFAAHRIVALSTLAVGSAAIFLGFRRAGLSTWNAWVVGVIHVVCFVAVTAFAEGAQVCGRKRRPGVVTSVMRPDGTQGAAAVAVPGSGPSSVAHASATSSTGNTNRAAFGPSPMGSPAGNSMSPEPLASSTVSASNPVAVVDIVDGQITMATANPLQRAAAVARPSAAANSSEPVSAASTGAAPGTAGGSPTVRTIVAMGVSVLAGLAVGIVGIIGAAGSSNGIIITAESGGTGSGSAASSSGARLLAMHAPASYAADSRHLQGGTVTYTTVNITTNVTEEVYDHIDTYPGGERDLCFGMSNFTVPTAPTSYACRAFALPRNVNLSAIEFELLVDKPAVVHHVVAFTSNQDLTRTGGLGPGVWDCYSGVTGMQGIVWAWAVGMGPMVMPGKVGFRVGMPDNKTTYTTADLTRGVPYMILQYHYSNPANASDIVDSSVLRMRVTDNMPPIEASTMWLGVTPNPIAGAAGTIPPTNKTYGQQNVFQVPASLPPASSMNPLVSGAGYRVFGLFYHMHLIGRRIWTETVRGGAAVRNPWINDRQLTTDNNYNFEMQALVPIYNATIMPNDTLVTRCVHLNSMDYGAAVGNAAAAQGRAVVQGENTHDEMCMVFLYMYPKVNVPGWTGNGLGTVSSFCGDGVNAACETFT